MFKVSNSTGVRKFKKENDAYDYAIKLMKQAGIKSDIKKLQPYISPELITKENIMNQPTKEERLQLMLTQVYNYGHAIGSTEGGKEFEAYELLDPAKVEPAKVIASFQNDYSGETYNFLYLYHKDVLSELDKWLKSSEEERKDWA